MGMTMEVNKIVVATDGSIHAKKAIELATTIAKGCDAEIVFCHVCQNGRVPEELRRMAEVENIVKPARGPHPSQENIPAGIADALHTAADDNESMWVKEAIGRKLLDQAQNDAKAKGVRSVRGEIKDGDPAQAILSCGKSEGADIIVMGSRGLGDLKGLLMGSTSHKVSQLAPCTVITVK